MISVTKLIELLSGFSPAARAYAYEGEVLGIVVVLHGREISFIPASETEEEE